MKRILTVVILAVLLAGGLWLTGHLHVPDALTAYLPKDLVAHPAQADKEPVKSAPPPTVTVVSAQTKNLTQTVLVTGTLLARREILIAPEIEGQRIIAIMAEEGDNVAKGQVLARLDKEIILAQIAQSTASLARAAAAIAQAKSSITQAEARNEETQKALKRAKPLMKSRTISESVFDQRRAAATSAKAQLIAAQDGLLVAKAEKRQAEAKHQELQWRLSKTDILAPAAGIISRRNAKIGAVATGIANAPAMYHLIQDGKVELDAEVPEESMRNIKPGQTATISLPDGTSLSGRIRLVSPEIDRATRLGRIRISLAESESLRVGGFARGEVAIASARALTIPLSAVLFTPAGATAKVVNDGRIETRTIKTGIQAEGQVQVLSGLSSHDEIVAKAGAFLRSGDKVRPVRMSGVRFSETN